ncbi:4'-phosphopantetheinyl transferase family protein [Streptomyces sp. NPDC058045]|uniref:4'-phosphopantetheinyl transferase family protein n=1 Tax=Streptomyces sp. NPDC058045 TaxID=3346311 RepID=UPI0036EE8775
MARTQALRLVAARLGGEVLDREERERVAAVHRPGDRDTYRVAHVGLRMLLGGYLGVAPGELVLERAVCPCCGGPHGRPVVRGTEVQFSLSHTRGLGLLAFADRPVRVDVEAVPSPGTAEEVG